MKLLTKTFFGETHALCGPPQAHRIWSHSSTGIAHPAANYFEILFIIIYVHEGGGKDWAHVHRSEWPDGLCDTRISPQLCFVFFSGFPAETQIKDLLIVILIVTF